MFTLPNRADVPVAAQADLDRVDIDILVAGVNAGVVSGCGVTAQGPPSMILMVGAGTIRVNGLNADVAEGTVTVPSADPTFGRFDLVTTSSTGVKSVVAGVAAADPVFPPVPVDSVALAAVYVAAGATSLDDTRIVDKRVPASGGPGVRDAAWYRDTSPDVLDDEFSDGSIDPAWTQVNTNTNTVSWLERHDSLSVQLFGAADASGQAAHALMRPLDGVEYPLTVQGCFRYLRPYAVNYQMWGPIFSDGLLTTSKVVWLMPFGYTSIGSAWNMSMRQGTFASIGNAVDMGNYEAPGTGGLHLRIQWRAANTFRYAISPDAIQWIQSADMTYAMTPTHFGFAMATWGGAHKMVGSVDHLRVFRTLTP